MRTLFLMCKFTAFFANLSIKAYFSFSEKDVFRPERNVNVPLYVHEPDFFDADEELRFTVPRHSPTILPSTGESTEKVAIPLFSL